MNIKIKKLHEDATIPTYATDGSACFDIYAYKQLNIPFAHLKMVPTGVAFEIPKGYALQVYSRSSHGQSGISLANSVGIIDSDYRGELKLLIQTSKYSLNIAPGDRVAQGMIVECPSVEFEEVSELSETLRGTGGFGSTGK